MSEPRLLPLLGPADRVERSDAARNRVALLEAAERVIAHCGVDALTMGAVAAEAGVGKGTAFRRFGSREGLMAALLNHVETTWQAAVLSGPPPLGPGAPPWDRLLAFGVSRLETTLKNADLIRNAGGSVPRSYAAESFAAMHLRYLLTELGVTGDLLMLTTALMAPLELPVLSHQVQLEGIDPSRIAAGWRDLARRIVGPDAVAVSPGGADAGRR